MVKPLKFVNLKFNFICIYVFVILLNSKWINATFDRSPVDEDGDLESDRKLRPLSSFILHHEPLSYNTKIVHERAKRSIDYSNSLYDNLTDNLVHIDFKAHGKQFNLRLFKDVDSVFSPDLVIENPNGDKLDINLDHIYSGYLEDEENLSKVYGNLVNGVFEGKIYSPKNGTYYVERSHRYNHLNKKKKNVHSVIYNSEDVVHPNSNNFEGGCMNDKIKDWMDKLSRSAVEDDEDLNFNNTLKQTILIKNLDNSTNLDKLNYQLDEQLCDNQNSNDNNQKLKRAKRQSGDFFGSNILNNNYHPFFSTGYLDSAGRILRNPQHRISLNHRDRGPFKEKPFLFHPPSPSAGSLKRRACSLYIQTDTYLWNHVRKEVDSDYKAREEIR